MSHEQIREDNIREVLAAALNLFTERGVEGSSVPQIAKHAGVSLRSVYRYFENKDDLVAAAVKTAVKEIEDSVQQVVKSSEFKNLSGVDQVVFLCRNMLNISKEKCKLQVCLNEAESYLTRLQIRDIFALNNESDNIIIRYFKEAFAKGVQDGTINKQATIDENYFITLAMVFRGFYNRIATVYSNEDLCKNYNPEMAIENYLLSIHHSISTEWERKSINNQKEGSEENA